MVEWGLLSANVSQQQRKQPQKNLMRLNYSFLRILKLQLINWNKTAVKYVLALSWTQKKKGAKCVEIISTDDKWQITAFVAGMMSREF